MHEDLSWARGSFCITKIRVGANVNVEQNTLYQHRAMVKRRRLIVCYDKALAWQSRDTHENSKWLICAFLHYFSYSRIKYNPTWKYRRSSHEQPRTTQTHNTTTQQHHATTTLSLEVSATAINDNDRRWHQRLVLLKLDPYYGKKKKQEKVRSVMCLIKLMAFGSPSALVVAGCSAAS